MAAISDKSGLNLPKMVRILMILVAITAILSLLYAIQYYLGGPVRLQVVNEIYSLDLSPDRRLVATGAADAKVRLWEVPAQINTRVGKDFDIAAEQPWPQHILSGLSGPVKEVRFTPDGATLVAVGGDGLVRGWRVSDYAVVQEVKLETGPLVKAMLDDSASRLATLGEDGAIQVWDLATEQQIQTIEADGALRVGLALSGDGTLVASGDGTDVQVWDAQTGEPLQRLTASCSDESLTTPEDCDSAEEDWLGHRKEVTSLAFSQDNALLATGGADTAVVFWDLESGEARWTSAGHWAAVSTVKFSEDGEFLLSGGKDYKTRNLRVAGGKSTAIFEGHLSNVNDAAYGPWDDTILTVADDGTLRVWEMANQYAIHLEWSRLGLQPAWGRAFAVWMLVSGLLSLLVLWGLLRLRLWGHLLALTLYLLGPVVVLGLPLFEVLTYPLRLVTKLQIAWPLLLLLAWYIAILVVLSRERVAVFYEAPREASLSEKIMVSQRTLRTRFGVYSAAVWIALLVILYSVLRRFNLDIAFMGSWLSFIMEGSAITFYVSAASIVLAMVLALLGALGRMSKNAIANAGSGFYISLIRGTPLLVQIYIWYLGLPRLGVVLDPRVAGILALGVNYGAYMTEIFRAGIQAVSRGQREAAQALGMSSGQTFRRIVLPQAFRIVIPPIGNEFIAMMKDSSLVSVMAVQELTWRANKVGRQYFRGMETFIIAAAFYWILTVIFQLLQGRLEEYLARSERR